MRKTSQVQDLSRWQLIVDGGSGRALGDPLFEQQRQRLAAIIVRVQTLQAEREATRGRLQEIYREIRELQDEGQNLGARLIAFVKGTYGANSTKLYKFGLRPDRRYSQEVAHPLETAPPRPESDVDES